jgi:hypothetical protein
MKPWLQIVAVCAITLVWSLGAVAEDVPDGALSAAIRGSGHPCAKVVEKEASGGESSVWQVRCNSGRFQVTQKDDSTFEVKSLD